MNSSILYVFLFAINFQVEPTPLDEYINRVSQDLAQKIGTRIEVDSFRICDIRIIITEEMDGRRADLAKRNSRKLLLEIEDAIYPRIMFLLDPKEGERFKDLFTQFKKERDERKEKIRERRNMKKKNNSKSKS